MKRRSAKTRHLGTRILWALMRRLRWIGVRLEPFITVREGETIVEVAEPPDTFRFEFLCAEDVDELIRLEPVTNREELNTWFKEGKLCFGVWDESVLIAKMWCDLNEFNYPPNYRKLSEDEAYLYAAFSDPEYRGQSLAPLMRAKGYAALRKMGRSKFYSYTDFFNTAARRFKLKLGARNVALRLHLGLFGKWSTTVTLRRYSPATERNQSSFA